VDKGAMPVGNADKVLAAIADELQCRVSDAPYGVVSNHALVEPTRVASLASSISERVDLFPVDP